MNYWFLFILFIVVLELGIVLAKHGQPKNENYSFWIQLTSNSLFVFCVYKAIQAGF